MNFLIVAYIICTFGLLGTLVAITAEIRSSFKEYSIEYGRYVQTEIPLKWEIVSLVVILICYSSIIWIPMLGHYLFGGFVSGT